MRRLVTILILFAVTAGLFVTFKDELGFLGQKTAFAVGDLTVDWFVPEGDPIFTVTNIAPGQTESRTVTVTNGSTTARPVGVRGVPTDDLDNMSSVMHIVISKSGTDLYGGTSSAGPKTLGQFFTESAGPDGIPLFMQPPGNTSSYTFIVTFDSSAGNSFQNNNLVFDLKIGIAIAVPTECSAITLSGDPIFGTVKSDKIIGTSGNDLIFAFEGGDKVEGRGGDDCIVGGKGGDSLNGEGGNDVVMGNEDSDVLYGGAGQDKLFGNTGSDSLKGGNGNDLLLGNEGSDVANGEGGGADSCDAESEHNCEL